MAIPITAIRTFHSKSCFSPSLSFLKSIILRFSVMSSSFPKNSIILRTTSREPDVSFCCLIDFGFALGFKAIFFEQEFWMLSCRVSTIFHESVK